jgi:hypothetical protein
MMEKSAQPGEGGGARPSPFTISTITYKVVVYAPAERADKLPLFLLYPFMSSVYIYFRVITGHSTMFATRNQSFSSFMAFSHLKNTVRKFS